LIDSGLIELSLESEEYGLVARHIQVGYAQDERLVAFVRTSLQQVRRLGVGARHDDSGHVHNVQLETRGVEALDLVVLRHQHLATLVAALLNARLLVLDVITGYADFHEAANQVPDVSVSSVAGIGIRNNERPIIELGSGRALFRFHAGPKKLLVLVGGEQSAHDRRSLVRHLTERVAGEVRARIFSDA